MKLIINLCFAMSRIIHMALRRMQSKARMVCLCPNYLINCPTKESVPMDIPMRQKSTLFQPFIIIHRILYQQTTQQRGGLFLKKLIQLATD